MIRRGATTYVVMRAGRSEPLTESPAKNGGGVRSGGRGGVVE